MKTKTIKKAFALLTTLTTALAMTAAQVSAYDSPTRDSSPAHRLPTSSVTADIPIKKDIVLFNSERKRVFSPNIVYQYSIASANVSSASISTVDPDNNTVVLGDDRSLFSKELTAWDFNWISGSPPEGKLKCSAKIRYRHKEQSARAEVLADGLVHVVFDDLQRAITPGQSVVLYNGDEVLGGGIIQRR
jgi:hypothetical protein